MSGLMPGDLVDITIRRASVLATGRDETGRNFIEYAHGEHNTFAHVDRDDPSVTVEPATFDVRHGDVWRDDDGDLWLAQAVAIEDDSDETTVLMHSALGVYTPAEVARDHGLAERVHREADAL